MLRIPPLAVPLILVIVVHPGAGAWNVHAHPVFQAAPLQSIARTSTATCVAVGRQGRIVTTDDGGRHFWKARRLTWIGSWVIGSRPVRSGGRRITPCKASKGSGKNAAVPGGTRATRPQLLLELRTLLMNRQLRPTSSRNNSER